jgi:hypothetical protein
MVVLLIHWFIKKGSEEKFLEYWKNKLSISSDGGLYREILTTSSDIPDTWLHTFPVESPYFTTYINIGIWRSVSDFQKAVGDKYVPIVKEDGDDQIITIKDFEFKQRERIVLNALMDRGINLPEASLKS